MNIFGSRRTTTPSSTKRPPWRHSYLVIPLALAFVRFVLSTAAQAQSCPSLCDSNFNTGEGIGVLASLTGAGLNTAIGFDALANDTTGGANTATGVFALSSNTTGSNNTATGSEALEFNITGGANTATGVFALISNRTGGANTATGFEALFSNTTGGNNTATGFEALLNNTTGIDNTASGVSALTNNITGSYNTAEGLNALAHNTTGRANTAAGVSALFNNTAGSSNTAIGLVALQSNTTGANNIAVGVSAGNNLTTGSNNIDIGSAGATGEGSTIRIGTAGTQTATFIAGIRGAIVGGGVAVVIDNNGHLGTISSSARFKEEIKPMDKASEAILALKPVTFRYKKEFDPDGVPQFGLVAEQVEKVNPDLVARDEDGRISTVRYEAVDAMLLNEFLKEHRKVEQQEAAIAQLKASTARQQEQIETLSAIVQKISNQHKLEGRASEALTSN